MDERASMLKSESSKLKITQISSICSQIQEAYSKGEGTGMVKIYRQLLVHSSKFQTYWRSKVTKDINTYFSDDNHAHKLFTKIGIKQQLKSFSANIEEFDSEI